jgi:adenylate kinase family enzyme
MRIVLIGAQGTGKTTLANMLGMPILPEAADLAIKKGFKLDLNASLGTEIWIAAKQVELENTPGDWVADRCLIDLLAYVNYLFPKDRALYEVVNRLLKENIKLYDHVFYLPAGQFPIENDGRRFVDYKFQREIDKRIVAILKHYKINYITLTGLPEERMRRIKNEIFR